MAKVVHHVKINFAEGGNWVGVFPEWSPIQLTSSFNMASLRWTTTNGCPRLGPDFQRPGARFSKVPKTFRARKAIRKTTTCLFCKAGLFRCCKGNKNKNNCKVSCFETPSFWRYKENYVTRIRPKSFGTFEKQAPDFGRLFRALVSITDCYHYVGHCAAFCLLKWRIWWPTMYFNPLK